MKQARFEFGDWIIVIDIYQTHFWVIIKDANNRILSYEEYQLKA